jgi:quinol monooxygenase YgiN
MSVSRREFVAAIAAAAGVAAVASGAENGKEEAMADSAVYVVATITVKDGKRDEFVNIFKANVPNVLAEDGCIFYDPVVDVETGIGAQGELRANVMVVVEKWASLDHLKVHLKAPHMDTYREQVKDLVDAVDLKVMAAA